MTSEQIKILVVNRPIYPDENVDWSLDGHIEELTKLGYLVDSKPIPPTDMTGYDIIVAHPPRAFYDELVHFHEVNPEIPLVLDSGHGKVSQGPKDAYTKDKDGVLISQRASLEDFLFLIEELSTEIRDRRD